MKTIYFVRHAESEGNIGAVRQGPQTPLSEDGNKQAEIVAKRFSTIHIDKFLSSPQKRAKHTAETINKVLNKEIEFTDLLIERKRPSIVIGMDKKSPLVLEVEEKINKNMHVLDYRYSDEENFSDLKNRAIELFNYINNLTEENILIVTHGIFLRMILAYVILGKNLTSHEYWNFFVTLEVSNVGISVFKQEKFGDEDPYWKLITWNDKSHLD